MSAFEPNRTLQRRRRLRFSFELIAPDQGALGRRGYFPLKPSGSIVVTRSGLRPRHFVAFSLSEHHADPIPHCRFPRLWSSDGVLLKGNARKKFALSRSQGAHRPDFSHGPAASCVPIMGDGRARDDKPTAQTTRCCIFGGLSPHRRNCRNRYIDSSKTGTNPAGTVVRGAPALVAARNPLIFLVSLIASD
jgi:hypothetical protein